MDENGTLDLSMKKAIKREGSLSGASPGVGSPGPSSSASSSSPHPHGDGSGMTSPHHGHAYKQEEWEGPLDYTKPNRQREEDMDEVREQRDTVCLSVCGGTLRAVHCLSVCLSGTGTLRAVHCLSVCGVQGHLGQGFITNCATSNQETNSFLWAGMCLFEVVFSLFSSNFLQHASELFELCFHH